jgi:hypothetical protein
MTEPTITEIGWILIGLGVLGYGLWRLHRRSVDDAVTRAIADSEGRFRLITETIDDVFWMSDSRIEHGYYISPAYETVWGRSRDSFYQNPKSFLDAIHPDDRTQVINALDAQRQGLAFQNEYRIIRPDGTVRWIHDRGFPVNGANDRYVGLAQDVTGRHAAARSAQELADRLQAAIQGADIGVWEWNIPDGSLHWEPTMYRLYGLQRDTPISYEAWLQSLVPEEREVQKSIWNRCAIEGGNYATEFRIRRPDGEIRTLHAFAFVQHDESGVARRAVGVNIDISPYKRMEAELNGHRRTLEQQVAKRTADLAAKSARLAETEQRFRYALEASNDGIWDWNLKTGAVFYSPAYAAMLGYTVDELKPRVDTWIKGLHPAERDQVVTESQRLLIDPGYYELLFRMRAKNGTYRWILSRGKTVERDAYHQPIRAVGTHLDLTERRAIERHLMETKQRLTLALEAAHAGVWDSVIATGELTLSEDALAIHGLPKNSKVTAERILAMIDPVDRPPIEAAMRRTLATGLSFQATYCIETPSGERRWINSCGVLDRDQDLPRIVGLVLDITDRKRLEEKLRESETRFRSIVNSTPDAVFLKDPKGRYLLVNQAVEDFVGKAAEDILGRDDSDLFEADEASIVMEQDQEIIRNGERRTDEEHVTTADGVPRTFLSTKGPIWDAEGQLSGLFGIARDITASKRAEDALRESELKYRTLFDNMAGQVHFWQLVRDAAGHITTWRLIDINPAGLRSWGKTRSETVGRTADEIFPDSTSLFMPIVSKLFAEHAPCTWETDFPQLGQYLRMTSVPFGECFISTGDDITAIKEKARELERAKEAAEASANAKSAFLANMSHEIRTPLNAITGMAYLIRRSGLSAEQAARMDKLEAASHHLLNVINDILDLSKIEAGMLSIGEAPISIQEIVDSVVTILAPKAEEKNLVLDSVVAVMPSRLLGDKTRLQQALLNYGNNAIKFTDQGRIGLRVSVLQEDEASALLVFQVSDTGVGIKPEAIGRLFNTFEQADNSNTRKYGGTGLGLAITKRLAQAMGGEAGLESQLGIGSSFWFTARLKRGAAVVFRPERCSTTEPETVLKRNYSGVRILLAEDDPINREVALSLLQELPFVVDWAEDGLQAVDLASRNRYDLILMDLQMPQLGGVEATKRIRCLPDHARTPILAMTANAFKEDEEQCLLAGMNGFLAKPVPPEELYARLLHVLKQRFERGK